MAAGLTSACLPLWTVTLGHTLLCQCVCFKQLAVGHLYRCAVAAELCLSAMSSLSQARPRTLRDGIYAADRPDCACSLLVCPIYLLTLNSLYSNAENFRTRWLAANGYKNLGVMVSRPFICGAIDPTACLSARFVTMPNLVVLGQRVWV